MVQQTISTGSSANDGTGDTLRSAGTKINQNFTELYGRQERITQTVTSVSTVGDSDDEFIFISRKEHEGVEKIHGFQTKKYTTIFETIKNRIKIDEWAVKELSLLRIADTLNKELLVLTGTPDSVIMASTYGAGLSNNEAVIG